jgi:hypothetical protein
MIDDSCPTVVLTGSILTRTIDVQTRICHAASVCSSVGANLTYVDSFMHIGHTLDHESSVGMDMFGREWNDCSLFETGGIVDLD